MSRQPIPYPLLLAVALFQGLFLLLLHQAIEFEFWPGLSPHWLISFYSMVIIAPTLLLLSYRSDTRSRLVPILLGYGLLTGLLGYYVGWQANPIEMISYDRVLAPYILTQTLAALMALVYIDTYCEQIPLNFHTLLIRAWRHTLTLAFALLFTLLSWGVLMLWGLLFEAIDVYFFQDLFTERWFFYPVLALLNGVGIGLFRQQFRIIDTVIKLVHLILWVLLIPLTFVSVIFLLTLLITGLNPLWDSGGSFLILWMQILIIALANVSYQLDDDNRPYPKALQVLVMAALLFMPVYSVISAYGLTLRIEQYGWTVARLWAVTIWGGTAVFALSYAVAVLRQRLNWHRLTSRINVPLGLLVIAVLLLTQSPLLDFRKLTVGSQLARLEAATEPGEVVDLRYFRFELARPGYLALQSLKTRYAVSQPAFADKIESLFVPTDAPMTMDRFQRQLTLLTDVDDSLIDTLFQAHQVDIYDPMTTRQYYVFAEQLDNDAETEYVVITRKIQSVYYALYEQEGAGWRVSRESWLDGIRTEAEADAFITTLTGDGWSTHAPQYLNVQVGDVRITFDGRQKSIADDRDIDD